MNISIESQEQPSVSVIIPTHNRLKMLKEALGSVFQQDFEGKIEVIVVDDNSQDGTPEILAKDYPEIKLISIPENVGAYRARNQGLANAQGNYIAFLDSDDLWEVNYLKSQISAFKDREKCFAISAIKIINTVDQSTRISYQKPELKRFISAIHQLLVSSSFIATSSVVFPRSVFEDIGSFDETFRVGSDREFYLRCLLSNYEPIWTEKPLAIWRVHDQGQLTNYSVSKIKLRKQTRINYLQKHSLILQKYPYVIPLQHHLYAEIALTATREFFRNKYYCQWIISYLEVGKYTSLDYVLFSIIRDILRPAKKILPSNVLMILRKKFLSHTLST